LATGTTGVCTAVLGASAGLTTVWETSAVTVWAAAGFLASATGGTAVCFFSEVLFFDELDFEGLLEWDMEVLRGKK
jgi:hypothetical protein